MQDPDWLKETSEELQVDADKLKRTLVRAIDQTTTSVRVSFKREIESKNVSVSALKKLGSSPEKNQ